MTGLPEDHSAPALLTSVPAPLVPADAQFDTLSVPTTKGRRRPTQHANAADDYDPETGE